MKVKLLDKLLDDLKHELWSDSFLGKNIAQSKCKNCNGYGRKYHQQKGYTYSAVGGHYYDCEKCKGTGKIASKREDRKMRNEIYDAIEIIRNHLKGK